MPSSSFLVLVLQSLHVSELSKAEAVAILGPGRSRAAPCYRLLDAWLSTQSRPYIGMLHNSGRACRR